MRSPVTLAELVADQRIGGYRVGHPQVGLREPKQSGALVAGQAVLLEKSVDPTGSTGLAQCGQQTRRECIDIGALSPRQSRLIGERLERSGFGNAIERRDGAPCDFKGVGQDFGAFRAREVTDLLFLSRYRRFYPEIAQTTGLSRA